MIVNPLLKYNWGQYQTSKWKAAVTRGGTLGDFWGKKMCWKYSIWRCGCYMSVFACENPVSSVIYDHVFLHVCSTPTKSWLIINRQTEGFGWGRQLKEWGQLFFHLTCIVLVLTQCSVGNRLSMYYRNEKVNGLASRSLQLWVSYNINASAQYIYQWC